MLAGQRQRPGIAPPGYRPAQRVPGRYPRRTTPPAHRLQLSGARDAENAKK
jgi:hypothetical protein